MKRDFEVGFVRVRKVLDFVVAAAAALVVVGVTVRCSV